MTRGPIKIMGNFLKGESSQTLVEAPSILRVFENDPFRDHTDKDSKMIRFVHKTVRIDQTTLSGLLAAIFLPSYRDNPAFDLEISKIMLLEQENSTIYRFHIVPKVIQLSKHLELFLKSCIYMKVTPMNIGTSSFRNVSSEFNFTTFSTTNYHDLEQNRFYFQRDGHIFHVGLGCTPTSLSGFSFFTMDGQAMISNHSEMKTWFKSFDLEYASFFEIFEKCDGLLTFTFAPKNDQRKLFEFSMKPSSNSMYLGPLFLTEMSYSHSQGLVYVFKWVSVSSRAYLTEGENSSGKSHLIMKLTCHEENRSHLVEFLGMFENFDEKLLNAFPVYQKMDLLINFTYNVQHKNIILDRSKDAIQIAIDYDLFEVNENPKTKLVKIGLNLPKIEEKLSLRKVSKGGVQIYNIMRDRVSTYALILYEIGSEERQVYRGRSYPLIEMTLNVAFEQIVRSHILMVGKMYFSHQDPIVLEEICFTCSNGVLRYFCRTKNSLLYFQVLYTIDLELNSRPKDLQYLDWIQPLISLGTIQGISELKPLFNTKFSFN